MSRSLQHIRFKHNAISTDVTSTVKIYADDTKIYRKIGSPDVDIPTLQCDLDRLGK